MRDAAPKTAREAREKRGPVLDVLRELLTERRDSEVLALVSKLMLRNSELERRLMQMLSSGHKNEGVSTAQLRLFLDALAATGVDVSDVDTPDLGDANAKLRGASGIDAATESAAEKPPKQPPLRKPPPANLPRVDNPIIVPAAERACPVCGAERTCIGHDVTEVIELEPARVVVRVDRREKLACGPCDGNWRAHPPSTISCPAGFPRARPGLTELKAASEGTPRTGKLQASVGAAFTVTRDCVRRGRRLINRGCFLGNRGTLFGTKTHGPLRLILELMTLGYVCELH